MRRRLPVALLTTMLAAAAGAQDISVYSTTIAQAYQDNAPGFTSSNQAMATEFLGIDANKLGGYEALSLHLYGWGLVGFADAGLADGSKYAGDLTYGYLDYRFGTANAELKAGRFSTNLTGVTQQVDGVSGSTDLRGGFTISAFAGQPVLFKPQDGQMAANYDAQQNMIFGARLGWRFYKNNEIGVSYVQDGSTPTAPYPAVNSDYTSKQLGVDLRLSPFTFVDLTGRTIINEGTTAPGSNTNVAEHDYTLTGRISETLSLSGTYLERNFYNYFAGTTLPNLFNQSETGFFTATGAKVTWSPITSLQVIADVKRTDRENIGDATRTGADLRYSYTALHLAAGAGYHKVNAYNVEAVDVATPAYSLSHSEARAWAMVEKGAFSLALDAIRLHFSDPAANPVLNGKAFESDLVGSLGYQVKQDLKVSADLSVESNAIYTKQTMALLRVEYRFGFASKGGK